MFLTGGGARGDIQSLVILRPLSVLVAGFGFATLQPEHLRVYRTLFVFAFSLFALTSLHLVPLPPEIWTALPGRAAISTIDRVAALGQVWRPLSLVPFGAWNAFYSLFAPLATLTLAVQIREHEKMTLLQVILALGLVSGIMGIFQVVGSADGILYFYQITNNGSAVGLFSNRNHQAIFLASMFPLLTAFAIADVRTPERFRSRALVSLAAGFVLIPLLLVTGSRAGLIVGLIGISTVPLIHRRPALQMPAKRKARKVGLYYTAGGFSAAGLTLLTVLFARAQAFERLSAADPTEELRFKVWQPIVQMGWKYFPFGSGIGSFVEVYQIDEPFSVLSFNYLNHAHNDWLEVFMTAGLPGITLLLAAVVAWILGTFRAFRGKEVISSNQTLARAGSVITGLLGLASLGDYPLRTPALSSLFVIGAIWMVSRTRGMSKTAGSR